ncbi:MAG TPA: hypothetical protein VH278_17480 [Burkholderiaceae bacterium]|nr:hypothetical protein [Burkholderiaceae bacterium]
MAVRLFRRLGALVLTGSIGCLLLAAGAAGEPRQGPDNARRDGRHDFDFNIGVWKTHITRLAHPLAGSTDSIEMNGTVTVRKIWDGQAQLEEIEADGPKGHWEALTLFLYNPVSHQWSQTFVNSAIGTLSSALVGEFKDGRGELYSGDTLDGRAILVRGVWSNITPDSHRYVESYSDDGGKTWEAVLEGNLTREQPLPVSAQPAATPAASGASHRDGGRDFDFDFGTWKTHSSRLLHPLTGATDWADMDGVTVVRKVWGGRANLAEFKADGPAGHVELLSLRWYNPTARQWNLDFATPNVGTLGIPCVGEFDNGRGDFYDQEVINGRYVLVRFSIWAITPDTAQSEQAFSDDGGRTWEVNWINRYTRIKGD